MGTDIDATPSRVGRYEIVLPVASGTAATVYLARPYDVEAGAESGYVALKLTPSQGEPGLAKQILDATKLTSLLRHPHVTLTLDAGRHDNGVFVVMEYIPGESLAGLVRLARERGSDLPRPVAI